MTIDSNDDSKKKSVIMKNVTFKQMYISINIYFHTYASEYDTYALMCIHICYSVPVIAFFGLGDSLLFGGFGLRVGERDPTDASSI